MPIASHQVGHWLRTEYDTAVLRAHQAADWQQFERGERRITEFEVDALHLGQSRERPHGILGGRFAPSTTRSGASIGRGDRWNCTCDLSSTDDPVTEIPDFTTNDNPHPGLDNNPGKDGKLFSDTHPYIANAYPGAKKAVKKLMGELDAVREAEESVRDIIEQIETGYTQGLSVMIGSLSADIKEFLLKEGIELLTDEVYMTDKQIQHALRTVKQKAGKSVTAEQLVAFPSLMGRCEVYWDKQKRNIQFITRQGNEVQKFVVELNYRTKIWGVKKTVNAFITAGIIEERNLGMQNIIKIK